MYVRCSAFGHPPVTLKQLLVLATDICYASAVSSLACKHPALCAILVKQLMAQKRRVRPRPLMNSGCSALPSNGRCPQVATEFAVPLQRIAVRGGCANQEPLCVGEVVVCACVEGHLDIAMIQSCNSSERRCSAVFTTHTYLYSERYGHYIVPDGHYIVPDFDALVYTSASKLGPRPLTILGRVTRSAFRMSHHGWHDAMHAST
jgi:hypothetical protein